MQSKGSGSFGLSARQIVADACQRASDRAQNAWLPIDSAPKDGSYVWVYVAPSDGLPEFETWCAWDPDAGWCADIVRRVICWKPSVR